MSDEPQPPTPLQLPANLLLVPPGSGCLPAATSPERRSSRCAALLLAVSTQKVAGKGRSSCRGDTGVGGARSSHQLGPAFPHAATSGLAPAQLSPACVIWSKPQTPTFQVLIFQNVLSKISIAF